MKTTDVIIKCPKCDTVQDAKVQHTTPFYTYIHTCKKCGYVIMESEFNIVENKTNK
mgnify:CR=1 FL=1